jgi:hypothetical protein
LLGFSKWSGGVEELRSGGIKELRSEGIKECIAHCSFSGGGEELRSALSIVASAEVGRN